MRAVRNKKRSLCDHVEPSMPSRLQKPLSEFLLRNLESAPCKRKDRLHRQNRIFDLELPGHGYFQIFIPVIIKALLRHAVPDPLRARYIRRQKLPLFD